VLVSELVLFLILADNDKVELLPEELALRDFAITQWLIKSGKFIRLFNRML